MFIEELSSNGSRVWKFVLCLVLCFGYLINIFRFIVEIFIKIKCLFCNGIDF